MYSRVFLFLLFPSLGFGICNAVFDIRPTGRIDLWRGGVALEEEKRQRIWSESEVNRAREKLKSVQHLKGAQGGEVTITPGAVDFVVRARARGLGVEALFFDSIREFFGRDLAESLVEYVEYVRRDYEARELNLDYLRISVRMEGNQFNVKGHSHSSSSMTYIKRERGRHVEVSRLGGASDPGERNLREVDADHVAKFIDIFHRTPLGGGERLIVLATALSRDSPIFAAL